MDIMDDFNKNPVGFLQRQIQTTATLKKNIWNLALDMFANMKKETSGLVNEILMKSKDFPDIEIEYKEIDALEKIKIEEHGYKEYKELFGYFLIAALMMFFLEVVLAKTGTALFCTSYDLRLFIGFHKIRSHRGLGLFTCSGAYKWRKSFYGGRCSGFKLFD